MGADRLVRPYLQPGDGRALTGTDVKVLLWLTDQQPGDFVVEIRSPVRPPRIVRPTCTHHLPISPTVKPTKKAIVADSKTAKDIKEQPEKKKEEAGQKVPLPQEKEQHYLRYAAYLNDLPFDADIQYRVKLGDRVIREATFRTRATAGKSVRCVLVGDLAQGRSAQKAVASAIALKKPEFLVALGDVSTRRAEAKSVHGLLLEHL